MRCLRSPFLVPGILVLALALASTLGVPKNAHAHGRLDRSSPSANSVVTKAPEEVVLYLTEAVDPVFSTIKSWS